MLSRSQRLTTRDFAVAFDKGRVLRHPLLQLRVHRRPAETGGFDSQDLQSRGSQSRETGNREARAAFVVPKKLGKATWRNRVRRRVRERYRILSSGASGEKELQNKLQNCDLIFFINARSEDAPVAQIDDAIAQLIRRASNAVEK